MNTYEKYVTIAHVKITQHRNGSIERTLAFKIKNVAGL